MFARILVPVDLTPKNAGALEAAAELAAAGDGQITLLHVIETIDLPFAELRSFYARLEEKAAAGMDRLTADLESRRLAVERAIVYGNRGREIVQYAADGGFDLIVLSSHRVEPEEPTANWATLSHKVAILAPCPVLLVK